jgi:dTDP-4-amino-4,6-dideoxygalactose transaminase
LTSIPLVDLAAQHREVEAEVRQGFDAVLATTAFINGPQVADFETRFAAYMQVDHCVGVANGTDALEIALRAAGIGAGDEVIIPANTFIATAEAVVRAGARPVLVDVEPDTLLMSPDACAAAVGPRTAAVMPVHLYGQMPQLDAISKVAADAGLALIEDAAQAQGARQAGRSAGSFGLAAGTSFYPGKNLGAYGDGGAVLTNSADVAREARLMANHGSARRYEHERFGFNSRLDTLQAVVLTAKLERLDRWNANRQDAARRYAELLAGEERITLPVTAPGNDHVWHLFVIQVDERDRIVGELGQAGIGAAIHYPVPVHRQPAFADLDPGTGSFPVTEASAARILSLPLHPHLLPADVERVAEVLLGALPRA